MSRRVHGPGARPPYKPLADQVVVITGASSGVGLATARKAAAAGARVFLVSRNEEALKNAVADIGESGGEAAFAVADVGDQSALERAADAAISKFGRIDTWVNNAGVAIYSSLLDTPRDEHERLFRTNYWGVVNGCTAAVARLRQTGGALITVGSIASDMGSPVLGAYVAAKHAAKGFIDSLRIELIRDGAPVAVTLIKPAGIDTPLNDHLANHMPGRAKIPPPAYAPELVAEAILHAAQHPVRELTVGGLGVAEVLMATHFPRLFDRIAGWITPMLYEHGPQRNPPHNLFAPQSDGLTRSPRERGMPFSLYTSARLHPRRALALALGAGVAAMVALSLIERSSAAPDSSTF